MEPPPPLPGLPRLLEQLHWAGGLGIPSFQRVCSPLCGLSLPWICRTRLPAFPSPEHTCVSTCVNMSRDVSVHGPGWVWVHVGERGRWFCPLRCGTGVLRDTWRSGWAREGILILPGSGANGREEFWDWVGNEDV